MIVENVIKPASVKILTLSEVLGGLSTNNEELIMQLNSLNEKLNKLGRPIKLIETKHEGGATFLETFQNEVKLNTTLINELNRSNEVLTTIL